LRHEPGREHGEDKDRHHLYGIDASDAAQGDHQYRPDDRHQGSGDRDAVHNGETATRWIGGASNRRFPW
jgi:hypothetical protein